MSEYVDSFLGAIKNRLDNKFISSVAISWFVVNYKFFLVVFGGGNYESKIKYIDNFLYDPGEKNWKIYYVPLIIGFAYVFLVPFGTIIVNLTGMFFKNLERKVVFWRKKMDVVSVHEKETYFSELATINFGLKDELVKVRLSESKKMEQQHENIRGLEDRLRKLAFKRLATTIGLPLGAIPAIVAMLTLSPPYINFMGYPLEYKLKLVDSQIFKNLEKLAEFLAEQVYDEETRKFFLTKEKLQAACGMDSDEIDEFSYYVVAMGLLKEVGYPDYGYITSEWAEQRIMRIIFSHLKGLP